MGGVDESADGEVPASDTNRLLVLPSSSSSQQPPLNHESRLREMLMNKRAKMVAKLDGDAVGAILSQRGHHQLEQPHTNGLIGATFPEKSLMMAEVCIIPEKACCNDDADDPLNWGRVAAGLAGSHLEEVKEMVAAFFECKEVVLEGAGLSVAQVAAIARRPEVKVVLDARTAKARVDESSDWVLSCAMKGTDTYGVTTGTQISQSPQILNHLNQACSGLIAVLMDILRIPP